VAEATRRGKLRPNSVDSLTGKNSATTSGHETPVIHFEQWERGRDRGQADPEGRRLREQEHPVLAALRAGSSRPRRAAPGRRPQVHPARRLAGAGPGLRAGRLGVCIGSDRAHGYVLAKEQLFRTLDDVNPESGAGEARSGDHGGGQPLAWARWASAARRLADRLQGHRGEPAAGELLRVGGLRLLGVPPAGRAARCAERARSRSGCTAIRNVRSWKHGSGEGFPLTGREVVLTPPLTKEQMRALKVGDVVLIRGEMYTGATRCTRT
jgi:fumarate hydratase, class I